MKRALLSPRAWLLALALLLGPLAPFAAAPPASANEVRAGDLDATFRSEGKVTADFGDKVNRIYNRAHAVAVQPDGPCGSTRHLALLRNRCRSRVGDTSDLAVALREIEECLWMPVHDFATDDDISPFNKGIVRADMPGMPHDPTEEYFLPGFVK